MRIVLVAFLAVPISVVPARYHDDIDLETHQFRCKLREPIELPLRISVLEGNVLSFHVTKVTQSLPNSIETGGLSTWIALC